MKRFKNSDVKTQAVSDFGMTLELYINTGDSDIDNGVEYPLLKVYADEETENRYLEIATSKGLVQIPVAEVKSFLGAADSEAHSEKWYEKNVLQDGKDT